MHKRSPIDYLFNWLYRHWRAAHDQYEMGRQWRPTAELQTEELRPVVPKRIKRVEIVRTR
jgi:hypothetical protein